MGSRSVLGLCTTFLVGWSLNVSGNDDVSGVLTYYPALLSRARERISHDAQSTREAFTVLQACAERLLEVVPYTVMDKTLLPASGDKHDYYSIAIYYWPNPNTADGLPYVNRDGLVNPETQGPETDDRRFKEMQAGVETLGLAYYFTGDERYAAKATELIRVWFLDTATRMNPHLNYGQARPGISDGTRTGIIQSRGCIGVLDAIALLQRSPSWTAQDQQGMVEWFSRFVHWLQTSPLAREEQASTNNHGTYFDLQLAAFALFAGQPQLARTICQEARTRRIEAQINSAGEQPEELTRTRTLHYVTFNLYGMFWLARIAEHVDVDLWNYQGANGASLRKALDAIAPYADSTRQWPYQQIDAFDRMAYLPLLLQGRLHWDSDASVSMYDAHIAALSPVPVRESLLQLLYPLNVDDSYTAAQPRRSINAKPAAMRMRQGDADPGYRVWYLPDGRRISCQGRTTAARLVLECTPQGTLRRHVTVAVRR